MIDGSKISVCAPVLNEMFFLPFWWKCVSQFADEVVITDGGSIDGTVTFFNALIADFNNNVDIDIVVHKQEGDPYCDSWNEGVVRNDLLSRCTGDYIFLLDADEIIDTGAAQGIVSFLNSCPEKSLLNLSFVPFWGDLYSVRVNTETDPRWLGTQIARVIRKDFWSYNALKHHCYLYHREFGRDIRAFDNASVDTGHKLYHLHYAFGKDGMKFRDNRRGDLGDPDAIDEGRAEPNFNLRTEGKWGEVRVTDYLGPWPLLLEDCL